MFSKCNKRLDATADPTYALLLQLLVQYNTQPHYNYLKYLINANVGTATVPETSHEIHYIYTYCASLCGNGPKVSQVLEYTVLYTLLDN